MNMGVEKVCSLYCDTVVMACLHAYSASHPRFSATGAGSGTMKVWKMQDLGLQTLQLVRTAANQGTVTTAMARFAQIVHNFPAFAGMVSSTKVSTAVREEVLSYTGEGVLALPCCVRQNGN
jgi:hypothetical protein